MKQSKQNIYIFIICLTATAIVLPIAFFGIPDAVDLPQHFRFAQIYHEAIISGNMFPGWAAQENFGYGDIGIRFYPPLEYYLLAVVKIIVGNWYDAAWITFIFWMILGCLGVYFWTKCWLPARESAIAAVFYAFVPLHLHQLYVTFNNYSEFASASILTFCFVFLTKIFKRNKKSDVLYFSVFFSLLILTHIPLTLIGSVCLFFYALILWRKKMSIHPILKCAVAGIAALSATSYYWIKVVTEISWLNHISEQFTTDRYNFENGFFPFFYNDLSSPESALIVDVTLILTFVLMFSALIYLPYKQKSEKRLPAVENILRFVLPLGLFALFFVTPFSRPIWQNLNILQKVQFPSRWLIISAICSAVLVGAAFRVLFVGNYLKNRIGLYGCLAFLSVIVLFNFTFILHPTSFAPINREKFESIIDKLPESQSLSCWWTIWAKPAAFEIKDKVVADSRSVNIISWQPEIRSFEVSAGNASSARIAAFYYPLWKATVNNQPVEIAKDENGVMIIPLPAEKSAVKVYFQEPTAIKIAAAVSIFTWLLFLLTFLFLLLKKFYIIKEAENFRFSEI